MHTGQEQPRQESPQTLAPSLASASAARDRAPREEALPTRVEEPTTQHLVREALDATRELVRLEVALAREELKAEAARAKTGALALGAAGGAAMTFVSALTTAIALAFAKGWLAALILAGIWLCFGIVLGLAGYRLLPHRPMGETKERIQADLTQLKERIA